MPKPDHRSQMARAWLHFHAARKGRGSGSAAPRVDWPVYPRRAEHNTVAEGGNRRWAETARQNAVPIALAEADQRTRGLSGLRWGAVARTPPAVIRRGFALSGISWGERRNRLYASYAAAAIRVRASIARIARWQKRSSSTAEV